MKLELRIGSRVSAKEVEKNTELSMLISLDLVDIQEEVVYSCRCGREHFSSKQKSLEQDYYCTCGRLVPNPITNGEKIRIIKRINHTKIKNYIGKSLTRQKIVANYDQNRRIFCINTPHKINVIIIGFSNCLALLSVDNGANCLFVNLNLSQNISNPWLRQTIDIMDLNTQKLKLLLHAIPINPLLRYPESELMFKRVLDKGDQYFEKDFTTFFIQQLREKDEKINGLIYRLEASNSLLDAKHIPLGMAGKSDFYLLPLGQYLRDGLRSNRSGEVKAYGSKTLFSFGDYAKAQAHAFGKDVLYIVSTNKIQQEVWTNLIEIKISSGYFKHVVLDRELILTLINVLEIDLKNLLNGTNNKSKSP